MLGAAQPPSSGSWGAKSPPKDQGLGCSHSLSPSSGRAGLRWGWQGWRDARSVWGCLVAHVLPALQGRGKAMPLILNKYPPGDVSPFAGHKQPLWAMENFPLVLSSSGKKLDPSAG